MSRQIPPDPTYPPDASELEVLSAYLDNALTEAERTALEQRLGTEPALRTALESLRRTIAVLKSAPELAPPRDFRLDPAKYRRSVSRPHQQTWLPVGIIGAAAAVLLVALIAVQSTNSPAQRSIALLPTQAPAGVSQSSNSPAAKTGISESATTAGSSAAQPVIATLTTSASLDLAVDSPTAPTNTPVATLVAPTAIPLVTRAALPSVLAPPTISGASNGAVAPQIGASNATNGSGGGVSAQAPALSAPVTSTPLAMLAAQPTTPPALPSTANKVATLWNIIRWLLTLLGMKGLS